MSHVPHILADGSDSIVEGLILVGAFFVWGISALAKLIKQSSQREKQRLRAIRESIEQSQRLGQQRMQPPRPPVQLAPEIARRVPPPRATRAPVKRPMQRPATNYNALAQSMIRNARPAPPPLPPTEQ